MRNKYLWLGFSLALGFNVAASTTKIGNADEGGDLEGAEPITEGSIVQSRDAALALVKKLNTEGVTGLGDLSPEIKSSELYLAKETVTASLPEDQGAFHSNLSGQVYARTFARPHAATRFFPAAQKLDKNQLVALHIHEALHRSLPERIREDEAIVSKLTLAITSPGATHDQIVATASTLIPKAIDPQTIANESEPKSKINRPEPSQVGYSLRQSLGKKTNSVFPNIRRLHVIHSYLYPFGSDEAPFGLGIEASVVEQDKSIKSGPLGLSGRFRLWSARGFEIDGHGRVALNTLSSQELVNSAFGRDIYTIGMSMRKTFGNAYIENSINYSFDGKSSREIGNVNFNYSYGSVVNPAVKFGYQLGEFRLGAYGEMYLASHFRVNGGSFDFDTGRYRIISAGPEVMWTPGNLIVSCAARFLVAANKDTDFSYAGDLMGIGVGSGGVEASVGYHF